MSEDNQKRQPNKTTDTTEVKQFTFIVLVLY